ncbi:MAG TPA: STAS domain-containing protein [Planctomycetaceae bacterium]|nr:STAS domain-containing protein [Planctomycetaceae bacterium]
MSQPREVFEIERVEGTLVVVPRGPALNFRYPDVHRESNELFRMMDGPALKNVLIDLSAVDYIDSVIIGALIRLLQKARARRGQAVFCSASEPMQEILKSIKIGTLWPLYATRDEALAAIGSDQA